MKYILVGSIFSSISLLTIVAQIQYGPQSQYKFKYLTIDQGLSNNSIRSICQDYKGFIWIGTQNGLNRFDGQSIIRYWHDFDDSTTLSSNLIYYVYQDSKNRLWICNEGGLDQYNMEYDNFTRFKHKDITWPIVENFTLAEDKNGKIWFGGATGVYSYDFSNLELQFFNSKFHDPDGFLPNKTLKLFVDDENRIWISVVNEGLYVYDQKDSTFTVFNHDPNDATTISGSRIEEIYEDRNGDLWFGTLNNGLNRYVPESNSFVRYFPDPINKYSFRVRAIFEDPKGNFFIGTRAGLYLIDKQTDKFIHYASEDHNFSKLSQNSIRNGFIDKGGTLWIGTFSGGLNYTPLHRKGFIHYIAGKNDNQYLSGSNIYPITEDSEGNLWIGGDNGLNCLDRSTYTFSYYQNDPNDPHSLSYNDVKSLEWDNTGNLWIGTNRGGLNYYNVSTGKFTSYRYDPDNPTSIRGDKIYSLLNDKHNNLWIIASLNNDMLTLGLDILPSGQDKFIHLDEKPYFGFDQDENGNIYIGGRHGFWIFRSSDSTFKFITNEEQIGYVNAIKIDSKNRIWIGSNNGLLRYTLEDTSFIWYSNETGYPVPEVFGILEDDAYNLWVSTISGLIKFQNIVNDTAELKLSVYDQYDGLQSKQFNFNSFYKCRSGEMVFGGVNGFNTFFPEQIDENEIPADAILTGLRINNAPVSIGEKIGDRVILKKSITVSDEIILGPNHKILTIEFSSLQNINPDKYAYKTKLLRLDNEWQYRKFGNNQVTYTNLSPGDYTFMVSAANNDGYWNEDPAKLRIIIEPPVYKTWWFRIIAGFGIIGLIIGIYYYRLRSIRRQNIILERIVRKRTEELEQHKNNLTELVNERTFKLEQALNHARESDSLKSVFLANMSHEIRTPMNAIVGFSHLLTEEDNSDKERAEFIEIIQSNSSSLLKIIDEILDLSLIESNQLKIVNEIFDLNMILDHLYSYYYLNNKNAKIAVKKNNTLQNLNLKLNSDSVRIKQIITNLLDNAFKFTEEGFVELGAYKDKNNLCIYVKDTGKGISSESIKIIFQHFSKVEDTESLWVQGLGLGLAISNDIAIALGGKILVDSTVGAGSTFTFSLPMTVLVKKKEQINVEIKQPVSEKWKGKTIMIAEDVEANYLYLKRILQKTQSEIIWAKNGDEAVQLAHEHPKLNLILMDIKMPKLDGYDAAKKIKKRNPNQIIVAQTAYARSEEKQQYYDKNFDEYISKPINPADLIEILEKFL